MSVPAGTVHAIGGGIVLAEIQQSSDTTYRLSDWGRVSADGKPRPLHLKEGLASVKTDPRAGKVWPAPARPIEGGTATGLVDCAEFRLERLNLSSASTIEPSPSFVCLGALSGKGRILSGEDTVRFGPGDWILVPRTCGATRIEPETACLILAARPD